MMKQPGKILKDTSITFLVATMVNLVRSAEQTKGEASAKYYSNLISSLQYATDVLRKIPSLCWTDELRDYTVKVEAVLEETLQQESEDAV